MKFSWHVFAIKITSRKFWVALAGLATSIMAFANCNSNAIVQVTAIIGALGSVVGYLIANGLTDDTGTAAAETGNTGSGDVSADKAPVAAAASAPQIPQDGLVQSAVAAAESATTANADTSTSAIQAAQAADTAANSVKPAVVITAADTTTK